MTISTKRSVNENSKFAKASRLYQEMDKSDKEFTRKDVIARFVEDLKLTQAGAATYYFKLRRAASE